MTVLQIQATGLGPGLPPSGPGTPGPALQLHLNNKSMSAFKYNSSTSNSIYTQSFRNILDEVLLIKIG